MTSTRTLAIQIVAAILITAGIAVYVTTMEGNPDLPPDNQLEQAGAPNDELASNRVALKTAERVEVPADLMERKPQAHAKIPLPDRMMHEMQREGIPVARAMLSESDWEDLNLEWKVLTDKVRKAQSDYQVRGMALGAKKLEKGPYKEYDVPVDTPSAAAVRKRGKEPKPPWRVDIPGAFRITRTYFDKNKKRDVVRVAYILSGEDEAMDLSRAEMESWRSQRRALALSAIRNH